MFFILITFALIASGITANKIILYTMHPAVLVAIRMFLGGLILFIISYFWSKNKLIWSQIKKFLLLILLIAVCTNSIPPILKSYGLKHMVSSKAALLGAMDPFVTPIFAYFFFNEKLNLKKIVGILIGFGGALILIFSREPFEFHAFGFISYPELAMLLYVVISRFGWILVQKLLKEETFTPIQLNTITMLISGVFAFVMAYFFSDLKIGSLVGAPFDIIYYSAFKNFSANSILAFFLAYTIIVGNVLAYNLFALALKKYSAIFISLMSFSVPLFVHFYGWLFLSEPLSIKFFISCLITFLGFYIFAQSERKNEGKTHKLASQKI